MTESYANQSVIKAMVLLEVLSKGDFQGMPLNQVARAADIPNVTAWRLLKTLESQGWAKELQMPGTKTKAWKAGEKLLDVAHAHEHQAMKQVHTIRENFFRISGKELSA